MNIKLFLATFLVSFPGAWVVGCWTRDTQWTALAFLVPLLALGGFMVAGLRAAADK